MAAIVDAVQRGAQAIVHGAQAAANQIRDAQLSPREIQERENLKRALEAIKLASIVTSVTSFFFFAVFPSLFTFGMAVLVAYSSFEVYNILTNYKEILDDATMEAQVRLSRQNLVTQLTKSAPIARSILGIINPSTPALNHHLFDIGRAD